MYTLYVIPGSHACRAAMLMLERKQVPYRRVDIVTLVHPLVVRGVTSSGARHGSIGSSSGPGSTNKMRRIRK
jgi:hypothetical protein